MQTLSFLSIVVLLANLSLPGNEKTITGDGICTKCKLGETTSCGNAVRVQEKAKTIIYYLVQSKTSKDSHEYFCKGIQRVKVTGTLQVVDGKRQLKPSGLSL